MRHYDSMGVIDMLVSRVDAKKNKKVDVDIFKDKKPGAVTAKSKMPLSLKSAWFDIPGLPVAGEPDPMDLIKVIRDGLPGSSVAKVAEELDVNKFEIYKLLHISPKTGQRAASKKLDTDKSDRLIQVVKVFIRAGEVFGESPKALRWLKSPCYTLGNQIPLELLDTSEGYELVMDTLGRIEYGVFG